MCFYAMFRFLDAQPSFKTLRKIVNGFADKDACRALGHELSLDTGFKDREIHRSLHSVKHITYGICIKWMQSYTDQANGHVLCEALRAIGRKDLACHLKDELCNGEGVRREHKQEMHSFEKTSLAEI